MRGFLFLLLFLISSAVFSESVLIPPDTPLYRSSDLSKPPFFVTDRPIELEYAGQENVRMARHPLARRMVLVKLKESGNPGEIWCNPDLRVKKRIRPEQPGQLFLEPYFLPDPYKMAAGGILILLALGSCAVWFRNSGNGTCNSKERTLSVRLQWLLPPTALVLFHCGYLLFLTGKSGMVPEPVDEISYFAAARGLAAWDFSGQWSYTIGWPIVEALFLRIRSATSFFDYEIFLTHFNGFFVMPLCLICAYGIFKKLSGSAGKAFLAVGLWQVLAIFWQFRDFWHTDKALWWDNIYKGFFALPVTEQSYQLYIQYTMLGFNALSDTISMLGVFLLILLILYRRPTLGTLIFFSLLTGYSCLIRLNNVMFFPLYAFLLWHAYREQLRNWKRAGLLILTGTVCFFAVFSLQLAVNAIQFGDILRFPYSLHDPEVYKGFLLKYVPHGIRFLLSVNYVYFLPGLLMLCFIRDRFPRTVLLLWIVPLTVFFFGYPQSCNNGVRFLLPVFCALCASTVFSDVWNWGRHARFAIGGSLGALLLLTAPSNYGYTKLLQWNLERYPWGAALAFLLNCGVPAAIVCYAAFIWKQERKTALFLLLLTGIYASGCVWLALPLMGFALVRCIWVPRKERAM